MKLHTQSTYHFNNSSSLKEEDELGFTKNKAKPFTEKFILSEKNNFHSGKYYFPAATACLQQRIYFSIQSDLFKHNRLNVKSRTAGFSSSQSEKIERMKFIHRKNYFIINSSSFLRKKMSY